MSRLNDLTGKTFGLLSVIKRVENDGKYPQWLCRCECGNEKVIRGYNLAYNGATSCGCQTLPSHHIHGYSHKEKLYGIWKCMRQRCSDPNISRADSYVNKGIRVCEEWSDYTVFREWALSSGYKEGLSIDRKDNDGNYCPENCRWATRKEQMNNTSTNRKLTFRGETKTLSEWADIVDISYDTLKRRVYYGWSTERILTTPVKEHKPYDSP